MRELWESVRCSRSEALTREDMIGWVFLRFRIEGSKERLGEGQFRHLDCDVNGDGCAKVGVDSAECQTRWRLKRL